MKKLIYLLVACLIFTACEKEPMLTLSLDQISASCEGNTTSVTLVSNNPWSVSGTDWCNVSPSSGEAGEINLTITIRENTTYDSRKCTLNFTSKELCSALSVNQESNYGFVSTVENILFSFKAQDSCFVINTNEDINISIDESSKEWLSILETKGLAQRIYQISLKQNNNANRREGKFYFKGVKSGNIRQLVVRQDGVVNLSENETANCYITSKKYFYKFKPTEGNSSAIIDNISSVQVMWETKNTDDVTIGDVIDEVYYDNGYIYFHNTGKSGNGLIVAQGIDGEVLWSWHIWSILGYDAESSKCKYISGMYAMDRNLGALSNKVEDTKSMGLLYQWGRKDPFLGRSKFESNQMMAAKPDVFKYIRKNKENGTIEYSIQNPTHYIYVPSDDYYGKGGIDFWLNEENNLLWSTNKSKYDPCPPGWRVPSTTTALASGLWYGFNNYQPTVSSNGVIIEEPYSTPASWYPHTGWLENEGTLNYYWVCALWTTHTQLYRYSLDGNTWWEQAYGTVFHNNWANVIGTTIEPRQLAIPVRCCK